MYTESDTAWHGGCLAVAELARRGLLLTPRLTSLATALQHALLYDVRRGAHSVGAHVRDAAAYVCWACARAYAPAAVAPIVHTLASTLLTVACYDREVGLCVRVCVRVCVCVCVCVCQVLRLVASHTPDPVCTCLTNTIWYTTQMIEMTPRQASPSLFPRHTHQTPCVYTPTPCVVALHTNDYMCG